MTIKPWLRPLLIIVPYFVCLILFQLLGYIIADIPLETNELKQKTLFQTSVVSFFTVLGTVFIVWIFVRYVDKEKVNILGLEIQKRGKEIVLALVLSFVLLGLSFILLLLTGNIYIEAFNFSAENTLLTFLIFLFVSISEEVFFRGYVLRNLMSSLNKYNALLISSLLFAIFHSLNPNISIISFVSLFIAGGALGISYIYTQNLWYPIALHFGWNFFQTHLGFNVSGQNIFSTIEISHQKANWLNGGDFGFEGSVLSALLGIILIVWGFLYFGENGYISNFKKYN